MSTLYVLSILCGLLILYAFMCIMLHWVIRTIIFILFSYCFSFNIAKNFEHFHLKNVIKKIYLHIC